ncbi:MAG: hypothetical protein QOH31_6573 [Verrucomicrobiota bacterium]|jgi:hypothetical protein
MVVMYGSWPGLRESGETRLRPTRRAVVLAKAEACVAAELDALAQVRGRALQSVAAADLPSTGSVSLE